jgi:hypothetical protein
MEHDCGPACECRMDLDAALTTLENSSRLLATIAMGNSWGLIDKHYADLRAAHIKVRAAVSALEDHMRCLELTPMPRLSCGHPRGKV